MPAITGMITDRGKDTVLGRFFRFSLALILAATVLASGCSEQTSTTTSLEDGEVDVTSSTVPHVTSDGTVLRVAASPFTNLDPAIASSTGDILVIRQVYDWLVEEDGEGGLATGLAVDWEETGPAVWTFKLRPNVVFHDGDAFDSADVVYTFERLASLARTAPAGAPLADFGIIDAVIADDGRTLRFVLTRPDPEFPGLLARDAAAVLSSTVEDPSKEWVGTGPFALWSYGRESATLRKNQAYWMIDPSNNRLPYLDGITIMFESDPDERLARLVSGEVDLVGGLTPTESERVKGTSGLTVIDAPSNEYLSIDVAVDEGRPGADLRVLQALKLGTDRAALTAAVRSRYGSAGNDSPVGPLYGALHLDVVPGYDPEVARTLLSEAGLAEGLTLTLAVPADEEAALLAEEWAAQLSVVGVTVEAVDEQSVQADGGQADAGISRWLSEPRPLDYLVWQYGDGADQTEGSWTDEEFASVMAELAGESDADARVALYHEAQSILAERGPAIVPFYESSVVAADVALLGVTPAAYWPRTLLRAASFGG